eukprot:CAMPEP_0183481312 /NCGR_PEP_ID=MMETSP0370-20130417/174743_1 /TAXON_ID=268820 /ORGANISM="Peridinium aciculiferum, Strain PAER-2" /LENGTH=62 /DNA_ID=CAMNT_0025674431 /DNA_START=330 /DNA_END=518 /DNA_ORIENTATION=+
MNCGLVRVFLLVVETPTVKFVDEVHLALDLHVAIQDELHLTHDLQRHLCAIEGGVRAQVRID